MIVVRGVEYGELHIRKRSPGGLEIDPRVYKLK
jgi:hypothetical protein